MEYHARFDGLCAALEGAGAFLVVQDKKNRVNIMTVGWAQAGLLWSVPALTVLVRPSRYTHALLAAAAHFSVCVPPAGRMKKELAFCGSRSGRDYDKARACGLTLAEGAVPGIKYIAGSALVYQCELAGTAELAPGTLSAGVKERYYKDGDAHTLYFGKIIKADHFQS